MAILNPLNNCHPLPTESCLQVDLRDKCYQPTPVGNDYTNDGCPQLSALKPPGV